MPLTAPGSPSALLQTLYPSTTLTVTTSGNKFIGVERYTTALFFLVAATVTGTSPTYDVYIQRLLPDNTTWQDIIHFTQVTTTSNQIAHFVTGASSIAAVQTAALAAATTKAISLGGAIRAHVVVGGTNPSASIAVYADFLE